MYTKHQWSLDNLVLHSLYTTEQFLPKEAQMMKCSKYQREKRAVYHYHYHGSMQWIP